MQTQGQGLTATLPREINTSVFPDRLHGGSRQSQPIQTPRVEGQPPSSDPVAPLLALLNSAPVDLSLVSEQVRSHPDLQALIVRTACALSFSPDISAMTIEDAVVVAGTNRLRALVYLWSLIRQQKIGNLRDPQVSGCVSAERPSLSPPAPADSEGLNLAALLHSLGLPLPPPAYDLPPFVAQEMELRGAHSPELAAVWIRDLLSLVSPRELSPQRNSAPVLSRSNASSQKESE